MDYVIIIFHQEMVFTMLPLFASWTFYRFSTHIWKPSYMLLQSSEQHQIYGQQLRTLVLLNSTNTIFVVSRKSEAIEKWCGGGGKTDSSSWLDICYPSKNNKVFSWSENEIQRVENVLTQAMVQQNS